MRADVAVVGAGIIGALAAYELAKRGVAVALLDAEKEGAATLASAGMLAPYPEGLSGELLEAGLYGLARYPELLAELRERGLEVEAGFSGTWVAALSLGEKEAWQAQDPLPYPVRGGLGARRFPGGFVHPKALREALLEAFRDLGGTYLRAEVEGIEGGRVHWREGALRARFVLLHAREATRLKRLLSRQDAFDRVRLAPEEEARLKALAQGVLTEEELAEALSLAPLEEVLAKLKIVAEEKKNYDPEGPLRLLEGHPRALVLDTEALSPEEEVLAVRRFLQEGLR